MTGVAMDRSNCAELVLRNREIAPCGEPTTVWAPEGMWPFAYCRRHAERVAGGLEVRIGEMLRNGESAAEERQKLEHIRKCLEGV